MALPSFFSRLVPSFLLEPRVFAAVTVLSLVLFAGSLAAIPWFVARLPADYFARSPRSDPPSVIRRPALRLAAHLLKNALGAVLFLVGLAMLVLPGQGLLTLVVSLVLLDFPGKHWLEGRVVRRPGVFRALNALRRRAGREPLVLD